MQGTLQIKNTYERPDHSAKIICLSEFAEIVYICPICGNILYYDDILERPQFNANNEIYFYCDECDEEFFEEVYIEITVKEKEDILTY